MDIYTSIMVYLAQNDFHTHPLQPYPLTISVTTQKQRGTGHLIPTRTNPQNAISDREKKEVSHV